MILTQMLLLLLLLLLLLCCCWRLLPLARLGATAKAVIETEAAAEAAEAAAPAAASEFKTYLMNCKSKKPI